MEKFDTQALEDQIKLKIGLKDMDTQTKDNKLFPAALYTSKANKFKKVELENLKGLKSSASTVGKLDFATGRSLIMLTIIDIKNEQLKCRLLYEWKNIFRALSL